MLSKLTWGQIQTGMGEKKNTFFLTALVFGFNRQKRVSARYLTQDHGPSIVNRERTPCKLERFKKKKRKKKVSNAEHPPIRLPHLATAPPRVKHSVSLGDAHGDELSGKGMYTAGTSGDYLALARNILRLNSSM